MKERNQLLTIQPLTQVSFAPFGDVIECADHRPITVNQGMGERFNDLAAVDTQHADGHPLISLFTSRRYTLPHQVAFVERHPLGSQAFMPLSDDPFLVVVGLPGESVNGSDLRGFVSDGHQGINYHRGVWHHVLLTPFAEMTFICIDRGGPGENCEERWLESADRPWIDYSP